MLEERQRSLEFWRQLLAALFAFTIIAFSVLIAIYRFYMLEAARFEYLAIGFIRVNLAYAGADKSVRNLIAGELLNHAFTYRAPNKETKGIDSPLPGHFATDLATNIVNRLASLKRK